MTRDEYNKILIQNGFVFVKTQEAWTQHRGQEDKYTHPNFNNYFYVKRISDEDNSPWGFNAQITNGKRFDKIVPHNAIDTFGDKKQPMWIGSMFLELMDKIVVKNSWVTSSTPNTYDAMNSLQDNGQMDWLTRNNWLVGDIVYIYEVIPPRGRGGIVYKTEVIEINISLQNKLEDREYWAANSYPTSLSVDSRFSRLKLIGEPDNGVIPLGLLKEEGFMPPQGSAYHLSKKLENYIETFFRTINADDEETAGKISTGSLGSVISALELLSNNLPPYRIQQVVSKIVRNPKIARLIKQKNGYVCELCGRSPFVQKNGQFYAEADHIRPLGGIAKGLDTPMNMRCLCAQCHAIITYGSDETISELFEKYDYKI